MKWFGTKRQSSNAQNKELNQLIFDIAEYNLESDTEEIYRRLKQIELFTPITSANFKLQNGQKITIEDDMQLEIPTVVMHDQRVLRFHVNKDDARLGQNFASMSVADAFAMIEKSADIAALVFYNDQVSYFGILRENFPHIKRRYLK
jgi:hypothetical protein